MRFDDFCSPVLVKEVRQALRGRTFAIGFLTALSGAILLASVSLLDARGGSVAQLVMPLYFVLALALLVMVPFHAHQSMRQEDAEGARDLLALSPMGPWRIVLGKLAAALVVAALTLAAFLPFIIVIALQPEVDTFGVLVLLSHLCGTTVCVTALGVSSGAIHANRVVKGAGVVVLGSVSLGLLALEVRIAEQVLRGRADSGMGHVFAGWLGFGASAPLLLGFAAAALARDDRDISRGLRIAWIVFAGAMAVMIGIVMPRLGARADSVVMFAVVTILAGSLVAAVLATEDERLDLESRQSLGRVRSRPLRIVRGLLAVGGGRGVALALTLGISVALGALVGVAQSEGGTATGLRTGTLITFGSALDSGFLGRSAFVLVTAIGASLAFAVLPAHIVGQSARGPRARRIARWTSAISLVGLSILLPLLLLVSSRGGFDEDSLFFSPLFVLMEAADHIDRGDLPEVAVFLWLVIGVVALFVALPSLARGVREVLDCEPTREGED